MTTEEFIKSIEKTFTDALKLIRKKNADYARQDDPFLNFKNAEIVGLTPERSIVYLMLLKITRISNLLDKPAQNESVEDSVIDLINYAAILKARFESNESRKKK